MCVCVCICILYKVHIYILEHKAKIAHKLCTHAVFTHNSIYV